MFYCNSCKAERDGQVVNLQERYRSSIFPMVNIGGQIFSITEIFVYLGIRKIATAIQCEVCSQTSTICPYCNTANLFKGKKIQRCDQCNHKYYNYA